MTFMNLSTGDISILIVDNDPLLRQALRDMLLMWGIRKVTTAGNGRDAVERLRHDKYDLLLTDWLMEPMDGEVLVRWVREAPSSTHRDIPIIVLTGIADLQTVRNAWSAGVDCVLAKPVPATTIARRIETVLSQPRRQPMSGIARLDSVQSSRAPSPAPQPPAPSNSPCKPPLYLSGSPPIPRITDATARVPRPDATANTTPTSARTPTRPMIRLLLALDRVESCMGRAGQADIRMSHALRELRLAAAADPTAAILAGSLAACVTWSDPDADSLDPAVRAHIQGLHRFASGAVAGGEIAELVNGLRALTKVLLDIDNDNDLEDDLPVGTVALTGRGAGLMNQGP